MTSLFLDQPMSQNRDMGHPFGDYLVKRLRSMDSAMAL